MARPVKYRNVSESGVWVYRTSGAHYIVHPGGTCAFTPADLALAQNSHVRRWIDTGLLDRVNKRRRKSANASEPVTEEG